MIARLIRWSMDNRFLVVALTLVLSVWGLYSVARIPLDAIPDLSDVQVIVKTSYPGQAPQVVEDQVTYPLTTALLSVPGALTVRGFSHFGESFVHVIFEDGTDPYWARSRVLEYLSKAAPRLPQAARTELGPDATGVGWVYEYALVDRSGHHDLAQLRALQDWFIKYELQAVAGVAEVASVGGMVKQYQVVLDPEAMRALGIPLAKVKKAIQNANQETGGSVIELAEAEYMVRARGYVKAEEDLRQVPLGKDRNGTPILLEDIARIRRGPEMRRGVADLDGLGEVAGGIVVMRYGENALATIDRVKARLAQLRKGLPQGVEIVETYDRSALIKRAVSTLTHKLVEEFIVVALVCALFLLHARSALVAVIVLPVGILAAFVVMRLQGINANIMSLGGIAIAIGVMVDAAIVMIENVHKRLEKSGASGPERRAVMGQAVAEVGPALFFSLLIITLSFLPVFTLAGAGGQAVRAARLHQDLRDGRRGAAVRHAGAGADGLFRARAHPPRAAQPAEPRAHRGLPAGDRSGAAPPRHRARRGGPADGARFLAADAARQRVHAGPGRGRSAVHADHPARHLRRQGAAAAAADRPAHPHGAGGAQRVRQDRPRRHRHGPGAALHDRDHHPAQAARPMAPRHDARGYRARAGPLVKVPGLNNAWLMPINARIDMLATGITTPLGVKVAGPDLEQIQAVGRQIETLLRPIPGTVSAYSERVADGRYIDIDVDRRAAARLGLNVSDVQEIVSTAIGGMNVTETVEGRERYPVNLRYPHDVRNSVEKLRQLPIVTEDGAQTSLGQLARVAIHAAPTCSRARMRASTAGSSWTSRAATSAPMSPRPSVCSASA